MIYIYYHLYLKNGVESIINEQLSLIEKNFTTPYIINFGINVDDENNSNYSNLERIGVNYNSNRVIRDIRMKGNEFTTLNLIYKDKDNFKNNDYILYIHTKGVTRITETYIKPIEDWRHFMNYYCIEKYKDAIKIFEKTDFNTYGCNLRTPSKSKDLLHYSGNFWWAKGEYLKTLDIKKYNTTYRIDAEIKFLQSGENWKPYCIKESGVNHYYFEYDKQNYR